jgi:hypothetical protein
MFANQHRAEFLKTDNKGELYFVIKIISINTIIC